MSGFRFSTTVAMLCSAVYCVHGLAAPTRLALIPSDSLRDSPGVVLLEASLSGMASVQMVERARLESIVGEAEITAAMGDTSAGKQIELGNAVGADRLILLYEEPGTPKPRVRVLILDCKTGARLVEDYVTFPSKSPGQAEQFNREAIELISRTQERFANGVQSVIGVTPFESTDLAHQHDDFQASAAVLVSNALVATPGVTVIELEGARAIRDEHAFAGSGTVQRITPVIVRGEFSYARNGAGEERVSIRVTLERGSDTPVTVSRDGLSAADVVRFLSVELPQAILAKSTKAGVVSMTEQEQFDALANRAERLSRVGAWELGIRLRNAALVLRPEDEHHRIAIVKETAQWLMLERQKVGIPNAKGGPIAADSPRGRAYRGAKADMEYLLRNRKLDAARALELATDLGRASILVNEGKTIAKYGFIREIFPLIRPAMSEPPTLEQLALLDEWTRRFGYLLVNDGRTDLATALTPDRGVRLAYIQLRPTADLLEALHPADGAVSELLAWRMLNTAIYPFDQPAGWKPFVDQLIKSNKPAVALYGRAARCWERWLFDKEPAAGLLVDVDKLMTDIRTAQRGRSSVLEDRVDELRLTLQAVVDGTVKAKQAAPVPTERPIPDSPDFKPPPVTGRVVYKRIKLSFKGDENRMRHVACGKELDVFYQFDCLIFRKPDGNAVTVKIGSEKQITDAAWDGAHLWASTLNHGVLVYDANGAPAGTFTDADGLPASDKGVVIHPIAPGRMLAVGSFGPENRAWCAVLEIDLAGHRKVDIFHKARRSITWSDARADQLLDPEMAFQPLWARPFERADDGAVRSVLIARHAAPDASPRYPLKIDLADLKVSVQDIGLRDTDVSPLNVIKDDQSPPPQNFVFLKDGSVLHAWDFTIRQYAAPGKKLADGKTSRLLCSIDRMQRIGFGTLSGQPVLFRNDNAHWYHMNELIPYRGAIWAPGPTWVRIDPHTLAVKRYADGPRELDTGYRFGISDSLGLLMSDGYSRVWQVDFVE